MKKSTKILIGSLAILLLIFLAYRSTKTGIEKSVIKNKVAKVTREPILGKEPVVEIIAKIIHKEIPFVQNKQIQHKYDENKTISSDKNLVVKWEVVDNPNSEDIKELNDVYYDFIEETSDARYFKADFTELFKKKVGDEVILVIDGEEFSGHITSAENNNSEYEISIQPIGENLDKVNSIIFIGGLISSDGTYNLTGDIDYRSTNGGVNYEFEINEKIGVILPTNDFQGFIDERLMEEGFEPY